MATLLELNDEFNAIDDMLLDSEGEFTPEIEAALEKVEADFTGKADGYFSLIREMELRGAARGDEARRLLKRARIDQDNASRLKERIMWVMNEQGRKKIETARYRCTVCRNSQPTLHMLEECPAEFEKVERSPDKTAIRLALKEGEELGFATLEQGYHLRIS